MKPIPAEVLGRFSETMKKRCVAVPVQQDYIKWLRYFLDYRDKYSLPESRSDQVRMFIQKLTEKGQASEEQKQAAHAISLFFESQKRNILAHYAKKNPARSIPASVNVPSKQSPVSKTEQTAENKTLHDMPIGQAVEPVPPKSRNRFNEWWSLEKSESPTWDRVIESLAAEIKTRHYSRKTLKAYADWSRKYQHYLKDKSPDSLSSDDVKAYLTHLAVKKNVSASTQNQAFNALLFLYRHILKRDFGQHDDIPRARRSRYIPVVLSRREIDSVLQ